MSASAPSLVTYIPKYSVFQEKKWSKIMEAYKESLRSIWTERQHQLEDEIAEIEREEAIAKRMAKRAMEAASKYLRSVVGSVDAYNFMEGEEILFFKVVKPYFIGQSLFYTRLFKIENEKPPTDVPGLHAYYTAQLEKVAGVYEEHRFVRLYIESGQTNLDEKLFFRPDFECAFALSGYDIPLDGAYPVCYDHVVGQLQAAGHLEKYILNLLEQLREIGSVAVDAPKLTFTMSQAAAIELIYAMYARGCFNHGKALVQDIAAVFGSAFNIKLRNPPRSLNELMFRKAGRTVFLDAMTKSFLDFIDSLEEKNAA